MNRYKNTVYTPMECPIFVGVGGHRDPVEEINGFVEIEEWDELANMTLLYRGYGLVTDDNPDPQFGDTDINEVMSQVYENIKQKKESESNQGVVSTKTQDTTEEVQSDAENVPESVEVEVTTDEQEKAAKVVADVEAAVAQAKADEAKKEVSSKEEKPEKKTNTRSRK